MHVDEWDEHELKYNIQALAELLAIDGLTPIERVGLQGLYDRCKTEMAKRSSPSGSNAGDE